MRASLYKDFVVNRTYLMILAAIAIGMCVAAMYKTEPLLVAMLFGVLGISYFSAVFARDAESKVNRALLSGPVTRTQLVNVNYLVSIAIGIIAFIATGMVALLRASMGWEDILLIASLAFAVTLLLIIIQLPLFYRFGPDKGKLFLLAVFILLFGGSSYIGNHKSAIIEWVSKTLTMPPLALTGFLLATTLVLTALSLWVSRRIAAGQEF